MTELATKARKGTLVIVEQANRYMWLNGPTTEELSYVPMIVTKSTREGLAVLARTKNTALHTLRDSIGYLPSVKRVLTVGNEHLNGCSPHVVLNSILESFESPGDVRAAILIAVGK